MKNYKNLSKEQLLEIIQNQQNILSDSKFGLFWNKEKDIEDVVKECEAKVPVLKADYSLEILATNSCENVLIEGDNFHSLSILNFTHSNSIDVIYVDPPYNTGATDWKYNNAFVDSEDTFKHTKWLNMMEKRFKLARELLTEEGVIVCSIDHYELFQLGMLMDQIFGENNRLGVVAVVHKPEGRNQEKFFGTSHEYALFYAKNKIKTKFNNVAISTDVFEKFDLNDSKGKYKLNTYINKNHGQGGFDTSSRENRPDFWYPVYVSKDLKVITTEFIKGYYEVFPITNNGSERTWRTRAETLMERFREGLIVASENKNRIEIYEKYYENNIILNNMGQIILDNKKTLFFLCC